MKVRYLLLSILLIAFTLLNSQVIVRVEKSSNDQLNLIEKLKINLVLEMEDYLLLSLESTEVLKTNKIDFLTLTDDHKKNTLVVVTRDGNKPLSRSSYAGEIMIDDHNLRLERLTLQNKNQPVDLNKFIPLRIMNNPYKNQKTVEPLSINQVFNTDISTVINSVNADSVAWFIKKLEDYGTRYALHNNRKAVSQWIAKQFIRFGYTNVVLDSFAVQYLSVTTWQWNVVVTEEGEWFPDQYIIIGGHHDSINSSDGNSMVDAPGADDNASGVACALEIARLIKKHNFKPKTSLRFVTFAMEEFGLYGAYNDVNNLKSADTNVIAMINSDMIGYLPQGTSEKFTIQKYPTADFLTNMALDFGIQMGMSMNTSTEYIQRSDSWAFHQAGYPSIFFSETDFTPHYHTSKDLLVNMNVDYVAKFIKLATKLSLSISYMPPPPQNYVIFDNGNGTLKAKWDVVGFEGISYLIKVRNTKTNATTTSETNSNELFMDNLEINVSHEITLYSVYSGQPSFGTQRYVTPQIEPKIVENFTHISEYKKINFFWTLNSELDINGYKIYRRESKENEFTEIANLNKSQAQWTDTTTKDNIWYEYKILAEDNDGHFSLDSNIRKARHVSHNSGILVMGFGATSSGSILDPLKTDVDTFYKELIGKYKHEVLGDFTLSEMDLESVGIYSTLIIINNSFRQGTDSDLGRFVKSFIDSGGNIFLSTNDPIFSLTCFEGYYPYTFVENDFAREYLSVSTVNSNISTRFAKGVSTGLYNLPDLEVDPEKTLQSFSNKLINIEAYTGNYQEIYKFSSESSDANHSALDGLTVMFKVMKGSSQAIISSIPLYSIKKNQANEFMQKMLEEFGEKVDTVDITIPTFSGLQLNNFPNPFNPNTTIEFWLQKRELVEINIYNIKGQLVKQYTGQNFNFGKNRVEWDGTGDNGVLLTSGVYFYQIKTESGLVASKKMVMIK